MSPVLLLLACTASDLPSPPPSGTRPGTTDSATSADTGDTGTPPDTESQLPDGFTRGDPIATLNTTHTKGHWETLDAAQISADRALVVANNGNVVVDTTTGEIVSEAPEHNGFHVEWDPTIDTAWVTTKIHELWKMDVSDPDDPYVARKTQPWSSGSEDLDCEDGLVLVSAHDDGAYLLDADLDVQAIFPASWAVGAGLVGGRAVITDAHEVVLIDWSEPTAPVELDRLALGVTGWDLDFDGTHVAVAQGSEGVAVLQVVDDTLVLRGELPSPGGVYGVSLDGDYLWAAAWSETMLAWLGDDEPVMVGHEPSAESAMALGSLDGGKVLVAEWKQITLLERTDFVAGAEVDLRSEWWWAADDTSAKTVIVLNGGAEDLVMTFEQTEGWTVEPPELVLPPGEREDLRVKPESLPTDATVPWTSNDPDEPTGELQLSLAESSIGQPHPEFTLESFTPPSAVNSVVTHDDLHGVISYINWFSPG